MDNFISVLRKLSQLYINKCDMLDDDDFDSYIDYGEAVFDNIYDEIYDLNDKDFSDFVSIVFLEYYNVITDSENDEVLDGMVINSKEDFIESIRNKDNDYLQIAVEEIVNCSNYFPEQDYYDYIDMDDRLTEGLGPSIYKKFHPNLDKDLEGLQRWRKERDFFRDIIDTEIKSVLGFIKFIIVVRDVTKNKSGLINSIICMLIKLKNNNPKLFDDIYSYMIQYYYVNAKNNPEIDIQEETIINTVECNAAYALYDENEKLYRFIEKFLSYDLVGYQDLYDNSSLEVKEHVKKLVRKNEKKD